MFKLGDLTPDFTLPDQDGRDHRLDNYHGSWVLLYFYPRDNTSGCTIEAKEFKKNYQKLKKHHVSVLGVSTDSVKSHQKFATKLKLPFPLLSDEEKRVVKVYQVWQTKKFMGRSYKGIVRTSFLIDPAGFIAKVYEKVKPIEHAEEVLADMKSLTT